LCSLTINEIGQFELVPIKENIRPHILRSQVLPPDSVVLTERKYDFSPCPLEADFLNHIPNLHELFEPGQHLGHGFWQCRTPKKLHSPMGPVGGGGAAPVVGWGLHIVERANWYAFCVAGLLLLLASVALAVVFAVLSRDVSAGFGMASYVMMAWTAVLTLYALGFAIDPQKG
jgi:hypothetical protein